MRIEGFSHILSYLPEATRSHHTDTAGDGENTYKATAQQVSEKDMTTLVERGNQALEKSNTRLEVSFHQETNQMMVKLIDSQTDEVIKEIPPEKWVDLVYNLCEQLGIFVDKRVG